VPEKLFLKQYLVDCRIFQIFRQALNNLATVMVSNRYLCNNREHLDKWTQEPTLLCPKKTT
jgi:hypothetical protein